MAGRPFGLVLMVIGALLALVGLVAYLGGFSWFGRLPGDIRYQGESTRVFIPITSMLILSLLLTLLVNLARRWF